MIQFVSVIICTHNPRRDFFYKVIEGLKKQSLELDSWELIIVDNGSKVPVQSWVNLSWHPNARIVNETNLGLTEARLKGICEASCPILIFVDDDNVLRSDYLQTAIDINKKFPKVGAYSGNSIPEYEDNASPPKGFKWPALLALRAVDSDSVSSSYFDTGKPFGGGMVVLKSVALYYKKTIENNKERRSLDRKGNILMSCGDTDMALCAVDLGLEFGLFQDLYLTHLIPKERLKNEYIIKLATNSYYSRLVLAYLRFKKIPPSPPNQIYFSLWFLYQILTKTYLERNILKARFVARKMFFSHLGFKSNS